MKLISIITHRLDLYIPFH